MSCALPSDHLLGSKWAIDFYTPPALRGAALFDNSAPAVAVYKDPVP